MAEENVAAIPAELATIVVSLEPKVNGPTVEVMLHGAAGEQPGAVVLKASPEIFTAWPMEVQLFASATCTWSTCSCTYTVAVAVMLSFEVAVMVTCPTPAVPLVAVQLMKAESHCPAQIRPPVDTVATLLLLLVKVISAGTMVPAEFSATTDRVPTAPWFKEKLVGDTISWEAVVLALLPPPHATRKERPSTAAMAAKTGTAETRCMYPPRRRTMPADVLNEIIPDGKP